MLDISLGEPSITLITADWPECVMWPYLAAREAGKCSLYLGSVTRWGTERRHLENEQLSDCVTEPSRMACGSGGLAWRKPGGGDTWQRKPENPGPKALVSIAQELHSTLP